MLNVFLGGRQLEAAVEVDARPTGVVEVAQARTVVGAYAAAEQEGRVAVVVVEHAPVELLAVASGAVPFPS